MDEMAETFIDRKLKSNKNKFRLGQLSQILFLNWLLEQDSKEDWLTLSASTLAGNQSQSSRLLLADGCYPPIGQLNYGIKGNGYFVDETYSDLSSFPLIKYSDLNPQRIQKAFNKPDALVLNADFIARCFEEYLNTMDLDKLVGFESSLPENLYF